MKCSPAMDIAAPKPSLVVQKKEWCNNNIMQTVLFLYACYYCGFIFLTEIITGRQCNRGSFDSRYPLTLRHSPRRHRWLFIIFLAGELLHKTVLTSDSGIINMHPLCFSSHHREWGIALEPDLANKWLDISAPILEVHSSIADGHNLEIEHMLLCYTGYAMSS